MLPNSSPSPTAVGAAGVPRLLSKGTAGALSASLPKRTNGPISAPSILPIAKVAIDAPIVSMSKKFVDGPICRYLFVSSKNSSLTSVCR